MISKTILKKWNDSNTLDELQKNTTVAELRELCTHFELNMKGEKKLLANRLWKHCSSESDDSDYSDDFDDSDESEDDSDESEDDSDESEDDSDESDDED